MKAIINTNVVMEDHIIWDGVLLYDHNTIVAVGASDSVEIPEGTTVIDAHGKYTTPGFVDIHNHGANEMWMFEKPEEVTEYFLKRGTTTLLCNIFYNLDLEGYLRGIENVRTYLNGYKRLGASRQSVKALKNFVLMPKKSIRMSFSA